MSFLDYFKKEIITPITITGPGTITSYNQDGTPINTIVTKYSDYCCDWLVSGNEQYNCSLLGYKEVRNVVMYPEKELFKIEAGDKAVIRGINFTVLPGENILNKDDVLFYKIGLKIRE